VPLTVPLLVKPHTRHGQKNRDPGWPAAGIEFPIHPHMLRHATGYKLANDGQDTRAIQHYLGHRNIQHTTRYTELAPDRFKDFWKD
jgi:type 1 fimbriae regulatory protein FimB/type 1 fimbriae regulatory protein FimE